MIAWGNITDRIILLLKDNELTKVQICTKLGLTHDDVSSTLTRLKRHTKRYGKRIYICEYVRHTQGKKCHLRPVFTAGNKEDAPKPDKYTQSERSKRTNSKKRAIKNSKIFEPIADGFGR
jgi:hypothetical protein